MALQTAQTYERAIFLTAVSAKDAVSETRPAERFLRTTEGEIVHRRIVLWCTTKTQKRSFVTTNNALSTWYYRICFEGKYLVFFFKVKFRFGEPGHQVVLFFIQKIEKKHLIQHNINISKLPNILFVLQVIHNSTCSTQLNVLSQWNRHKTYHSIICVLI